MRPSSKRSAEAPVAVNPRDLEAAAPANPFISQENTRESLFRSAGIELDENLTRRNRRLNAISIGAPLTGSIAALLLVPVIAPTIGTAAIFAVFFLINALGAGVGLHRYFTHGSFKAHPSVAFCLAVAGSWAMQGPIARWVADHRRHHRFADMKFDPHSPYWNDEGEITSRFKGWVHAHILWMFAGRPSSEERYAKDILSRPLTAWCTRYYWLLAMSGLLAPAGVGFVLGGPAESLLCFLWAGCIRVTALHHITWSINSFGHIFGTKVVGSKDQSRNNVLLAFLLLGEGLHSFHHRYPAAAINQPVALDMGGMMILALERLGLATKVRRFD